MNNERMILFVDDDCEFCKAMKKVFEKWGYTVTLAADGREALDILSKGAFDLIISDLRMPRMNGVELMGEIVRRKIRTPVIFLTAHGEVESYMDLMNMGAFDYLNKPVEGRELLHAAKKALKVQDSASCISCS